MRERDLVLMELQGCEREVRTLDGWEPYTPLLDTVVTLPSATGTATELYRALVAALGDASTVPVVDGCGRFALDSYREEQPYGKLTLRSPSGPARVLLDEIISQSDYANSWSLVWVRAMDPSGRNPTTPHWGLGWDMVQPDDDAALNRTPLTGRVP